MTAPRLSRDALAAAGSPLPAAPERIVHLGVGAFHRAHQAWYTAHADDAAAWGIVAFTGRRPDVAEQLGPQQGVYTLVTRGPETDTYEHLGSIVRVEDGSRVDLLVEALASPAAAIVTLTVTEVAYHLTADGIDLSDPATAADVDAVRASLSGDDAAPTTVLGRLLLGLATRAAAGGPALAVVPCDNLPDNGARARRALLALAAAVDPGLPGRVEAVASFVSTSIDRITPRTTEADVVAVERATGWHDASPVITEPFSSWVLAGSFPAGRPAWESAGASFVTEIEPVEARKLWMLNGTHTLLACAGLVRGHETVAQAIGDPACRAAVEALWDEAARHLPADLELDAYRAALVERYLNPRMAHRLAQIETDSVTKLGVRVAPVARRELAAGRAATGCAGAVGAWVAAVRAGISSELALDGIEVGAATADLVSSVDPSLGADAAFVAAVDAAAAAFTA